MDGSGNVYLGGNFSSGSLTTPALTIIGSTDVLILKRMTAVSNTPWIAVTAGSRGTGSRTVAYSAEANAETNFKTGTITIAGNTFTVTQDALETVTVVLPGDVVKEKPKKGEPGRRS